MTFVELRRTRLFVDRPDWYDDAACRGADQSLFFPNEYGGMVAHRKLSEAKQICAGCPVRFDCLNYAVRSGEVYGVWGGVYMPRDGREARKLHRLAARCAEQYR